MSERLNVNLPFCGFYGSILADELDHVESMEAEWMVERQAEDGIAEELRLDEGEFAEILLDVTDYSAAHHALARDYTEAFAGMADDLFGFATGIEHETMTSPRFYNFETDRVFAWVPLETVQRWFEMSAADGHKALGARIGERFTSRDGFISGYTNRLIEWLEKPLDDWDHNELGTLLQVAIGLAGGNDDEKFTRSVEYAMLDGETFHYAHSNAVDWPKFEEKVAELRAEKLEEIHADDPEWVAPYRCPETPDLFA